MPNPNELERQRLDEVHRTRNNQGTMPIKEALLHVLRKAAVYKETSNYGELGMAKRFIHKYFRHRHDTNLTILIGVKKCLD